MRKVIHPRLIGLFVLGGFIIIFLFIVLIGGGNLWLARRHHFVLYFDDSLNGLTIGSAVKFRGVIVGSVTDIIVQLDQHDSMVKVPVIIQITPSKIKLVHGNGLNDETFVKLLLKRGLRAQLRTQSMVSGALFINLDFYPDKPGKITKTPYKYLQIPTLPSSRKALANALQTGQEAFAAINEIIQSRRIEKALDAFTLTMNESQILIKNMNKSVIPAAQSAQNAFEHVNHLFVKGKVEDMVSHMNQAMMDARSFFSNFNRQLDPATNKFDSAMTNFSDAMYSFNALTDYLSRHPESLLRGKKPQNNRGKRK